MSMFKLSNASTKSVRYLGVTFVVLLSFIYRYELLDSLMRAFEAGPLILLLIPLFFLWNYIASWGWGCVIDAIGSPQRISTFRLSILRWVSQSANLVLPFSVSAPIMKTAYLIVYGEGKSNSAASVALDTFSSTVSGMVVSVFTVSLYLSLVNNAEILLPLLFILVLLLLFFYFKIPHLAGLLLKSNLIFSKINMYESLERISEDKKKLRRALSRCLSSHLLEQILMAFELYIISSALDVSISISEAAFASGILFGFTTLFFFIPGQVGAAEGAVAISFSCIGLPPEVGLSVGLIRRARQITIYGIGLLFMLASIGNRPFLGFEILPGECPSKNT